MKEKGQGLIEVALLLILAGVIIFGGIVLLGNALDSNGNGILDSKETITMPIFSEHCYNGDCTIR